MAETLTAEYAGRDESAAATLPGVDAGWQARRTFAIISHPDAGKTTLTEKLLLYGGAIQLAGEVKARGRARRARSDWMKIEQQRGISVTASVMTFEHDGLTFNLLDTPGHEDFSEDTYRTLTAVDSAVMVIDAAKGIESADAQAVRGLPAARRADHHLHQQGRPRGPRPVRAARRDRRDAGARRHARMAGRSAWAASSWAARLRRRGSRPSRPRAACRPQAVPRPRRRRAREPLPAERSRAARGGRAGARAAIPSSTSRPIATAT